MARQVVFKQTSGNKSEHRKCANKIKQINQANKLIKQTNKIAIKSSNQTDQANKQNRQQIKQSNRSSKQTKGQHLPFSYQGVETSCVQKNQRQTKASIENGPIKLQTNQAIKQIKKTNKIAKRQRSPCSCARRCARWGFYLKGLPLQLLPEIAKLSRLVISANRRSGIRPGPGDGPGTLQSSTGFQAKRSVLILRAVLAAGRLRPVSACERPQAYRARAPRGSASVPARESLARARPMGPGRSFSARDPASPGVACSSLVPRRALIASARAVRCAPSESVPRGTQALS
jgi:hypothetical protein